MRHPRAEVDGREKLSWRFRITSFVIDADTIRLGISAVIACPEPLIGMRIRCGGTLAVCCLIRLEYALEPSTPRMWISDSLPRDDAVRRGTLFSRLERTRIATKNGT